MLIPDASYYTSKAFVNLGRRMIGASVIFCFTSSNALVAAVVQLNSPLFHIVSEGGNMMVLNP